MHFKFVRASATKNTFIILDNLDGKINLLTSDFQKIARYLCQGIYGFSTDGFFVLQNSLGFNFEWDFFNADGSIAEMCGNAARCAALYYHQKTNKKDFQFNTLAGEIAAKVINESTVQIAMTKAELGQQGMVVDGVSGDYIDSGVPHFVIEQKPDINLAQKLRKHADFAKGANITFVQNLKPDGCEAVTFERGVEDFTQACGTGAVAAAKALDLKNKSTNKKYMIQMPGGMLAVDFLSPQPHLTGEVQMEFSFEVFKKDLL